MGDYAMAEHHGRLCDEAKMMTGAAVLALKPGLPK
jgi:hypothetical protein